MSRTQVFRLFLLSLVASSATAVADGPDYSYIQGSYGQIEIDDVDVDGDGFGISGSAALTQHFHLFGGYTTADMGSGVDLNQLEAGIGYNHPVSDTVDVVLSLAYLSAEIDLAGLGSVDDSGYGMGIRSKRFALYAENGIVRHLFVEAPGEFKVSGADHVLAALDA